MMQKDLTLDLTAASDHHQNISVVPESDPPTWTVDSVVQVLACPDAPCLKRWEGESVGIYYQVPACVCLFVRPLFVRCIVGQGRTQSSLGKIQFT